MSRRIDTFNDFWDFYVGEHQDSTNRRLHFIGTSLSLACLAGAVLGRRKLAWLAPVLGYGFAWVGHFAFEKNKPASFKYPLWSLLADHVMWAKTITGTMQAEVERVAEQNARDQAEEQAPRAESVLN
jgi:hypothetical protein